SKDGAQLIAALDEALRGKDQRRAAGGAARYGALGDDAQGVFAKLRQYGISEGGAVPAGEGMQTGSGEERRGRAGSRRLQGLARVTASAGGQPAPGVAESRRLLGV